LSRPNLGHAGLGHIAELFKEVSAVFKLRDGFRVVAFSERLQAVE
jgi:hypothetical protein